MTTITVMDPVTRIEGHLKVELAVNNGRVEDARCTGTLFRGFERLLVGKQPRDAVVLTQRICGVCPISHGQAATLAIENASGRIPPHNARLLRNLTLGSNYLMSHILHFYLLAALDYADGPQTHPWTPAWRVDFRPGLGTVAAHVANAVEARRVAHELGALFCGRMPTTGAHLAGGYTNPPNRDLVSKALAKLDWLTAFIRDTYIPDVLAVAELYSDYYAIGAGPRNLLAFGAFEQNREGTVKLFRPGFAGAASAQVENLNQGSISEEVAHSWYQDGDGGKQPLSGSTNPTYPKADAYSWLKAPRYNGKPAECGPLARMWINGDYRNGISVMDRHAARALEALKVAQAMNAWLSELVDDSSVYSGYADFSATRTGIGMTEAPRGALGHWIKVGSSIEGYQIVTPTCWNASPRDAVEAAGPMEQALIGTPIQDPLQPIEALRVIHSFDPCLSCAVHVMRPGKKQLVVHAGQR